MGKRRWKRIQKDAPADGVPILHVTPHTGVHKLATAMATQQRQKGAAVLKVRYESDAVMSIAAKALATLPHLSQNEDLGSSILSVIRWNVASSDAKFAYVHLFSSVHRSADADAAAPKDVSDFAAWAGDV